jgi:amidophosphoribosyltransferase
MCGIVGIINQKSSSFYAFDSLRTLQHRGEESCGLLTFDVSDGRYREHKDAGLVSEVFNEERLRYLKGSVAIGHTRYPTSGKLDKEEIKLNAQPYYVESPCLIAAVHNGQFTNQHEMKRHLEKKGRYIKTAGDLEPFLKLFAESLNKYIVNDEIKDSYIVKAVKDVRKIADGGYSVILLIAKGRDVKLVCFTGRKKIRPLVYGKNGKSYCLASETSVLDVLNYDYVADVKHDEIIIINRKGKIKKMKIDGDGNAFCMFEWAYFSRPDSVINDVSVYDVRVRLGRIIGSKEDKKIDVVVPVPKSGYKYAEGYGQVTGIQPIDALYKNEYIGRMFIRPPGERKKVSRVKLNPIRGQIKGKSVALLDDSIVRGETMKRNVELLKKAGAKEVHVRIGTPKFISPCYYGIDMATPEQFIARYKKEKQIAKHIKANSLKYPTIEDLIDAIGKPKKELCLGCLTGHYPTNVSKLQRKQEKKVRPYE